MRLWLTRPVPLLLFALPCVLLPFSERLTRAPQAPPTRLVQQSQIPAATVPEGFGVNIHFTEPEPGEMERFIEAGYGFARMDLFWHTVETRKGSYDFSAYDRLVEHLVRAGVRPLFILDYGNGLYQQGAPRSPEARKAFARFAAAAASRYRGKGVVWEIWNEPENSKYWQPEANAQDWAALAIETARAIHQADKQATVIGPAVGGFAWEFLESAFQKGVLDELDGVSVHPYRTQEPETAVADFARLRALIARYAPLQKQTMPMICSEWGYSTAQGPGVSEIKQAQYITRLWLANLTAGVNLSIFYDWRNDGTEATENEHNFGTVRRDFTPKPSFAAAKQLIASLRGYTFRHRLAGTTPSEWKLLFQKGDTGALILVTWNSDPSAPNEAQMPSVQPVPAGSDTHRDLLRLSSIRIPAGAIPVGGSNPAATTFEIVGADSQTAHIQVEMESDAVPGKSPVSLSMVPGRLQTIPISLPVSRRRTEREVVQPRLRWNDTLLPALAPLELRRVDPLLLTAAPAGRELSVTIQNPGRTGFEGTVRVLASGKSLGEKDIRFGKGDPKVQFTTDPPNRLQNDPADRNGNVGVSVSLAGTKNPNLERTTVSLPLRRDEPLEVVLIDGTGQTVASLPARLYTLMPGFDREAGSPSGFSCVEFEENQQKPGVPLKMVATPRKSPAATALQFVYQFEKGWRYAQAAPVNPQPMPDGAKACILWIHSDGSGDHLRSRFKDATGQTFQIDLGKLEWRGWRPVTIPLDGSGVGVSWGGANDKVPHGPRTWEGLILVDSANTQKAHGGVVLVAAPTYVTE